MCHTQKATLKGLYMASIVCEDNGHRMVQFVSPDKKRKTIRLGKISERNALAIKVKVEQLLGSAMTGHALDSETAQWVAGLDLMLSDKLADVGLIPRRDIITLIGFVDAYIK